MFANKIVDICIIQPHTSAVCWVFKVGDIKYSNHCAKDFVYERRMSIAKTETGFLLSSFANLRE